MYASMGGLHLNPIDIFSLGNLLKPMGHKMAEISPFELSESVGVDNFIVIMLQLLLPSLPYALPNL